jgi:hypothetical protein
MGRLLRWRAVMIDPWTEFAHYLETCLDLDEPNQFDVSVIEALMVWPDDPAWRARAARAGWVEYFDSMFNGNVALLPPDILTMHLQITRLALPIDLVHGEVKKGRIMRGLVAGEVLRRFLATKEPRPSVESIANRVLDPFQKAGHRLSVGTYRNEIRRTFRPVVHFWAAAIETREPDAFPCRTERLAEFLALADSFRLRAEAAKLKRQGSETFMRPGEAFPLPKRLLFT